MVMLITMPAIADYAKVNGLNLYYEIHGKADDENPPLVLLHGGGSTIETSFGRVLPLFAKTRRVIAFDQQGHGRTADIAGRPFSFEQSADDAAELLKQLGVTRADFFGYSNGGSIALQIAIRHPKLARRIVVAAAMYKHDGLYEWLWDGLRHASLDSMPKELREEYLRVAPHPENLQSFHDKSVQRMLTFKDWPADSLRSIAAPALIMIGDDDVTRPEHAVEMYRLIPHSQLAVLPGTNHMTFLERADWQVSMIEAFLNAAP
jgi:pimeloyl-ACP methyl ester carboxylesterase